MSKLFLHLVGTSAPVCTREPPSRCLSPKTRHQHQVSLCPFVRAAAEKAASSCDASTTAGRAAAPVRWAGAVAALALPVSPRSGAPHSPLYPSCHSRPPRVVGERSQAPLSQQHRPGRVCGPATSWLCLGQMATSPHKGRHNDAHLLGSQSWKWKVLSIVPYTEQVPETQKGTPPQLHSHLLLICDFR